MQSRRIRHWRRKVMDWTGRRRLFQTNRLPQEPCYHSRLQLHRPLASAEPVPTSVASQVVVMDTICVEDFASTCERGTEGGTPLQGGLAAPPLPQARSMAPYQMSPEVSQPRRGVRSIQQFSQVDLLARLRSE